MSDVKDQITVQASAATPHDNSSLAQFPKDDTSAGAGANAREVDSASEEAPADLIDKKKKGFLAYFTTKEFYIILILG